MGEIRIRKHLHSCEFYGSPVPLSACGCMVAMLDVAEDQLTERDREIERLNGIVQSQAFLKECAETPLMRDVLSQLSASQAREREAVRTAKIQAEYAGEVEKENLHLESALAAARKALEEAPCVCYVPGYSCLTADPRPPFFCRRCAALERINGEGHE